MMERDSLIIPFIQINLPAHKDYLCSNFMWFESHLKLFGVKT